MDMEQIIMNMVVNAGDARSKSLEAVHAARGGDFDKARLLLQESDATLTKVHETQTGLIVGEVNGSGQTVTLLMVHAQDHFMNAMTVRDLAEQLVEILNEKGMKS